MELRVAGMNLVRATDLLNKEVTTADFARVETPSGAVFLNLDYVIKIDTGLDASEATTVRVFSPCCCQRDDYQSYSDFLLRAESENTSAGGNWSVE